MVAALAELHQPGAKATRSTGIKSLVAAALPAPAVLIRVSGTIGQPDASSAMTGGTLIGTSYSLTGGFWALYAVQTPGAPLLTITCVSNQAIVSWPLSATGWILQTNANLAAPTWANYVGAIINNRVTNSPPRGNVFFRLSQ